MITPNIRFTPMVIVDVLDQKFWKLLDDNTSVYEFIGVTDEGNVVSYCVSFYSDNTNSEPYYIRKLENYEVLGRQIKII